MAEQMLQRARASRNEALLLTAHEVMGDTLFYMGRPAEALAHLKEAIRLYDRESHHSLAYLYGGYDLGVASLGYAAHCLWLLGDVDQARTAVDQSWSLAESLSHPGTTGFYGLMASTVHQLLLDAESVERAARATLALAEEKALPVYASFCRPYFGWALARRGLSTEGIEHITRGLAEWRGMGGALVTTHYLSLLAEAHVQDGDYAAALEAVEEGIAVAEQPGERWWEAELHRPKGALLLSHTGDTPAAEISFNRALSIARHQQARSLELRATVSLCRLWREQGRREEARILLSGIYETLTQGFDTPDLQQAHALLHELRAEIPILTTP